MVKPFNIVIVMIKAKTLKKKLKLQYQNIMYMENKNHHITTE